MDNNASPSPDAGNLAQGRRPFALPELFIADPAFDVPEFWMPFTETVMARPLWICLQRNMWANILAAKGAGKVNRHYHPHPVQAYTISGQWGYEEHDWIARKGDVLFEPPGIAHTLLAYESDEPMRVFFVVEGPLIWVDDDDQPTGHYDAFDFYEAARTHFGSNRLGTAYAESLLR